MSEECEDGNCPTGGNGTPVPERLCWSRRETINERIESEVKSIKNALYLTCTFLSIVVAVATIIQLVLK